MPHVARRRPVRSRALPALAAAVLCAAASSSSIPAEASQPQSLPEAFPACQVRAFDRVSSGHLDFGPVVTGQSLTPALKDDRVQPAAWKHPGGMILELGPAARRTLPASLGYIAPAGTTVYMIGDVQQAGVPWLGWNTQHPGLLAAGASDVTMTLTSVRGPGQVAVFTSGTFGKAVGSRIFDTVGGPRSTTVPLNTHAHGNWVFTKPGAYQLTISFAVRTRTGAVLRGSSTLNVAAGLQDSARAFSGCGTTAAQQKSTTTQQSPSRGASPQQGSGSGQASGQKQGSLQKQGPAQSQGSGQISGDSALPSGEVIPGGASSGAAPQALSTMPAPGTGDAVQSADAAAARSGGLHWPSLAIGAATIVLLAAFGRWVYWTAVARQKLAQQEDAQQKDAQL